MGLSAAGERNRKTKPDILIEKANKTEHVLCYHIKKARAALTFDSEQHAGFDFLHVVLERARVHAPVRGHQLVAPGPVFAVKLERAVHSGHAVVALGLLGGHVEPVVRHLPAVLVPGDGGLGLALGRANGRETDVR